MEGSVIGMHRRRYTVEKLVDDLRMVGWIVVPYRDLVLERMGAECREFVSSRYLSKIEKLNRIDLKSFDRYAKAFAALSSDIRIEILALLSFFEEPVPACLIAAVLGRNPQLVSYHLRVLKESGFVKEIEYERFRLYELDRDRVKELIDALTRILHLDEEERQ